MLIQSLIQSQKILLGISISFLANSITRLKSNFLMLTRIHGQKFHTYLCKSYKYQHRVRSSCCKTFLYSENFFAKGDTWQKLLGRSNEAAMTEEIAPMRIFIAFCSLIIFYLPPLDYKG